MNQLSDGVIFPMAKPKNRKQDDWGAFSRALEMFFSFCDRDYIQKED